MPNNRNLKLRLQTDEVQVNSRKTASARVGNRAKPGKRSLMFGLAGLTILTSVGGTFYKGLDNQESESSNQNLSSTTEVQGANDVAEVQDYSYVDEGLDFSFNYRSPLTEQDLADEDVRGGILARLTAEDPPTLITVRKESGLRLPASMAKLDTATLLKNNIDKSLPQRYPGFDQQSSTTVTVNGKTVIERVFTYDGPSGGRAKQYMVAVLKDDDTAIYLSMQTTEPLYDAAYSDFFSGIKSSISFRE